VPGLRHPRLDAENLALLHEGELSVVLHHDLALDLRRACHGVMQAHGALPGAPRSWHSGIQVVPRTTSPPRHCPSPDRMKGFDGSLTLTALQDACEWTVTSSDPAPVTGREFRGQRSPHAERPIDRRRVRDVTGIFHRPLPPPLPRRAGRERWDGVASAGRCASSS
jgi:hypothetical protein